MKINHIVGWIDHVLDNFKYKYNQFFEKKKMKKHSYHYLHWNGLVSYARIILISNNAIFNYIFELHNQQKVQTYKNKNIYIIFVW